MERCLGSALSLRALLVVLFPNAEFVPVEDPAELKAVLRPFRPAAWLAVTRRRERLPLASPYEPAGGPLGFESRMPSPVACGAVDHLYPWVPVPDDWCVLTDTWLAYPAPLWMVARFGNGGKAVNPEASISACEQILACAPHDQTALAQRAAALRDVAVTRAAALAEGALRGAVLLGFFDTAPRCPRSGSSGVGRACPHRMGLCDGTDVSIQVGARDLAGQGVGACVAGGANGHGSSRRGKKRRIRRARGPDHDHAQTPHRRLRRKRRITIRATSTRREQRM